MPVVFLAVLLAAGSRRFDPAGAESRRPRARRRPSSRPTRSSRGARFAARGSSIQMRVMQLREERLECVREALRRRLPDALWAEVPSPSRGAADAASVAERCSDLIEL